MGSLVRIAIVVAFVSIVSPSFIIYYIYLTNTNDKYNKPNILTRVSLFLCLECNIVVTIHHYLALQVVSLVLKKIMTQEFWLRKAFPVKSLYLSR